MPELSDSYANDCSDNSDTANPYRTIALEKARIAALWPQVVSAQVFSVESCHDDSSSFDYPSLLTPMPRWVPAPMGSHAACDGRSTSSELSAELRTSSGPMALPTSLSVWDFAPLLTNPVARGFFVRISSEPSILQPLLELDLRGVHLAALVPPGSTAIARGIRRGEIK